MDAIDCTVCDLCHWHATNRFRYLYPAPVNRVVTRLRLLPRLRHGAQRVARASLSIDPQPRAARSWIDELGNCVVEVEHAQLATHLEVTAEACVTFREEPEIKDDARLPDGDNRQLSNRELSSLGPPVSLEAVREIHRLFLPETRLVDRGPEIAERAEDLRRRCASEEALAWECMRLVSREMCYLPGSTSVQTRASEALAQGCGVCQDFAQVMLAILRAAGIPARYVSGHMEGEGQMHAWVEVLLTPGTGGPPVWRSFDPTHARLTGENYVTVAVGRDYADVSPISGRCYGPYPGRLSAHQQLRRSFQGAAGCV